MKEKQFAVEHRDLSKCQTTELQRVAHYAHVVGETLAQAGDIESDIGILADLEDSIDDEIADIGAVLLRVERRVAEELASRS
jgi:hypothetical protein